MIELKVEHDVRIVTFTGSVTPEDLRLYLTGFSQHPDYDPSHHSLVDLTGATSFDIDSMDVGEVERRAREIFAAESRRIAFVVASDLARGYARAFEIQHSDSADEVRIFGSVAEARSWLGLPAG